MMTIKELIDIIDVKIEEMGTPNGYHPRRLKPKWRRLTTENEKLEVFIEYIGNPIPSIGFERLLKDKLPHKTLESIIIEYPKCLPLLKNDSIKQICVEKFNRFEIGIWYLKEKKKLDKSLNL